MGLHPEHRRAEMNYWIGRPFRGGGYATEVARAVLRCGFEQLGMKHEGVLRQQVQKWGQFEDIGGLQHPAFRYQG